MTQSCKLNHIASFHRQEISLKKVEIPTIIVLDDGGELIKVNNYIGYHECMIIKL